MMIVTTGFVFISSLLGLLFATSFGVWVFQFFESDLSANSKSNAKIRKTEQKPSLKVEPLFKPGKNADFLDWAQYGAGLCAQKQYFEALFALDKAWHLSPGECGTTKIETEIALQQCECLIALERIDQARACLKRVSIYLDDNRFEDLTPRALELTSRLGIDKPEIQKESPLFELEWNNPEKIQSFWAWAVDPVIFRATETFGMKAMIHQLSLMQTGPWKLWLWSERR
jgi:hypothetical protein